MLRLATFDPLVVRPHDHDNPVAWDQQATDLTRGDAPLKRQPDPHLQLREPTEAGAVDGHDTAADWWLLTGTAVADITARPPPQVPPTTPEPPIRCGDAR